MSGAAYMQDMLSEPPSDLAAGPSEVVSFYDNRNVLLTGGTGFLGRLLAERILRSCPDVNTLYLLVRAKKGKNPEERLKELFDDVIFERLKKENPGFIRKVVLIEGDMAEVSLGLSSEQRELLRSTHIVIHGAATVRFDEKLRIAVNINVRGTQELLSLAKEMVDLKAFVHISTAYSNCVSNVIEEKFYSLPTDFGRLQSLTDILDDAALDHLTPVLLGKWPNTYAFTKAVAEDCIRRNCEGLPLCIVRPSIITATSKEPIVAWTNNFYGPTGVLIGAGVGLLRTLHCDPELIADLIPADYVVNAIIVAAWDIGTDRSVEGDSADKSRVSKVEEAPIYNVVSSSQTPIKWRELMKYTEEEGLDVPSIMSIWYYCFKLNKYLWIHNLYVIFLHLIPAAIVDSLAWLTGRKPMLWGAYKKIHKFSSVTEFFTMREWKFEDRNTVRLREKLSPTDRSQFDLDIGSINWREYCYQQIRGLRVYVVKDSLDTLPQARAKYAKLKVAHYTLVTLASCFLLWFLWIALRFIGLW